MAAILCKDHSNSRTAAADGGALRASLTSNGRCTTLRHTNNDEFCSLWRLICTEPAQATDFQGRTVRVCPFMPKNTFGSKNKIGITANLGPKMHVYRYTPPC